MIRPVRRTSCGAAGSTVGVGGREVRELGPGAVLGELALLTGEHRSADVRARRDTTVLEVPRTAFEEMLAEDATASRTC